MRHRSSAGRAEPEWAESRLIAAVDGIGTVGIRNGVKAMTKGVQTGLPRVEYGGWSSLPKAMGGTRKRSAGGLPAIVLRSASVGSGKIQTAALSHTGKRRQTQQLVPVYSERGRLLSYVSQPLQRLPDRVHGDSWPRAAGSSSFGTRRPSQALASQLPEVLIDPGEWAGAIPDVDGPSEVSPLLPVTLRRSDEPVSRGSEATRKAVDDPLEWKEADRDKRDKIAGRWATGIVVKIFAGLGLIGGAIAGFVLGGPAGAIAGASAGFLLIGGLAATVGYIAGYCYATATINSEKKAEASEAEREVQPVDRTEIDAKINAWVGDGLGKKAAPQETEQVSRLVDSEDIDVEVGDWREDVSDEGHQKVNRWSPTRQSTVVRFALGDLSRK